MGGPKFLLKSDRGAAAAAAWILLVSNWILPFAAVGVCRPWPLELQLPHLRLTSILANNELNIFRHFFLVNSPPRELNLQNSPTGSEYLYEGGGGMTETEDNLNLNMQAI